MQRLQDRDRATHREPQNPRGIPAGPPRGVPHGGGCSHRGVPTGMCSQGDAPTGGMPFRGGSHGGYEFPRVGGVTPSPPSPRSAPPGPSRPSRPAAAEGGRSRSGAGAGAKRSKKQSGAKQSGAGSMAPAGRLCAALLCGALSLCSLRAAGRQPDTLYLWIEAQQARVLIGFEEDILIVSEGKMAPFTHDFRKAQQRMPAIPVNIHAMNFTWQATGRAEYFYEFLSLRSLDKGIMADPTINIPLLGTVPHKASVVQVGFPCLGKQDGVAAFEVNVIIMNSEGNIILQTPQNAIFFKTCQQAECPGGCRNGGFCNERHVCECPDGFYGPHCEKANCTTTCFNGGTCFYLGKCICPSGFEGDQCEISKCHQPCRNGGKCTGKNKCKCSKGYQGDLCSKPVCEPGCGLYGTCTEPNKCQCKEGWHGRHCNKRYGASGLSALRPAGTKHRQHTPSPKKAEERHAPPESNYIW
uniref:Wnt inhibitory factor 1 n=1 Tax=Anas platyrhynchos platyrhynchos TaxID=8840 RepID=U3IZU1_ANAPP